MHFPEYKKIVFYVLFSLVFIFPVLNLFNCWDNFLSFNLYSNKPNFAYIAISDNALKNIEQKQNIYFTQIENLEGGKVIDLNAWAFKSLNVPIYPEKRVFEAIYKYFCNCMPDDVQSNEEIIFLEYKHPIDQLEKHQRLLKSSDLN